MHFLLVYSYQNSDNDKYNVLLPASITIGKKIVNRYLNNTRDDDLKGVDEKNKIYFLLWLEERKTNNSAYSEYLDDTIYTNIGCDIIQLLKSSDIIKKILTKTVVDHNKFSCLYTLEVLDDSLLSTSNKHTIINMPTKLPMVVKPKSYSKNVLGGYLLNDVKFAEGIFIEKKAYSINYVLSACSNIYDMINKISSTPFKIN